MDVEGVLFGVDRGGAVEREIIFIFKLKLGGAQFALYDRREESAIINGNKTKNYFAKQFFVEFQIIKACSNSSQVNLSGSTF
jgi:hypothetical protein